MKKLYTLLMTAVTVAALYAQAPSKFSYQAVVRNSSGVVVPNGTSVSFRFTIHDGSAGGTILYQETQSKTTNNAFGLVNLEIGAGTVQQGAYPNASQWSSGSKFLQVEVDPAGGSSFTDLGATQISSVPYANYAGSASGITGTIAPSQISSGSASNGQVLQWNGSNWVPATVSGSGGGDITSVTAGTGLSGGGTSGDVTLNATNTAAMWNADKIQGINVTAGATNGQFLKFNGTNWVAANDNNTVTTAGTGLSLSGSTLNSVWTASGNNIYNNNSGNVGIGVNAPLALMHTKGSSEVNRWEFTSSGWNSIYSGSSYLGYLGVYNSAAEIDFGTSGTGTKLNLVTGATPRLTVSGNKVGVGTRSPNAIFQVSAEDNSQFVINGSKTAFDTANTTFDDSGAFLVHSSLELGVGHIVSLAAMGSDNGNYSSNLAFYTRGGSATDPSERMRINGVGNVGIGTKSPSYLLDVAGIARTTGNMYAGNKLSVGSTLAPNHMSMVYGSNSTGIALTQYVTSTTGTGSSDGMLVGHNNTSGEGLIWNFEDQSILFGTNSTDRMVILNTGEVGIGTSSPTSPLHVSSSLSTSYTGVAKHVNTSTGTLTFASSNIGGGSGVYTTGTYVGDWAAVSGGSGQGWGQYGNSSNSTTNYAVYGNASGGTTNYSLYCAGNGVYTGTWSSSSDVKLKKDVNPIEGGLSTIMKLKPSSYYFKTGDAAYKSMNLASGLHYGFIAQELEKVIPSLVSDNVHASPENPNEKIEYKGVNYTELIPILTKAIQEQQAQIEELKKEVEVLKAAQK